jgi:hypothetical protein
MLLAWLLAGAHVALEHGGKVAVAHAGHGDEFDSHDAHDHGHGHHHDDDGEPVDDPEHHHELGAAVPWHSAKSWGQQLVALQWIPIYNRLIAALSEVDRGIEAVHVHSVFGDSPPDTRLSGWLFVAQTALQVRGPSRTA